MALAKNAQAITQLAIAGTSTTITTTAYRQSVYIQHVNGTGTITTGATVAVQVRPANSPVRWYTLLTLAFGTTASPAAGATETRVVPLPDDAGSIQLVYAVPTGSTGHTLDAQVGEVTGY
jgi:hypothetical protein